MSAVLIARRWLHNARAGLLGWSVGLAAVTFGYLSFFGIMDADIMGDYMASLPEGMVEAFGFQDLSSGAGYAQSTVYGLLGPVLLLIAGMTRGVGAIAGDEASGALEVEVTAAAERRDVYVGRALGLTVFVLALGAVVALATAVVSPLTGMDLSPVHILAGASALTMLGLVHAMVAFAVGAATGRPAVALGVTVAVAVLGWFAYNLGPRLADWVQPLSPWDWAYGQSPLAQGFDGLGLALLAALTLVAFALGLLRFPQRDLGV